jgi:membrane-bound lytic murein transglycosylase F
LQKSRYYKKTKHGYARGSEPVHYVDNIRRYYDVLVWQDEENQEQPVVPQKPDPTESIIADLSDPQTEQQKLEQKIVD